MTRRRYAYLHGFASGPLSRKSAVLAAAFEARGLTLERPDLNQPSFAALTWTGALAALDALHAEDEEATWGLIGSSMGGYLAARWAQLHPERVERLLLLCPGFHLAARWPALIGVDAFARWEDEGTLVIPDGAGVPTPLHWAFVEDARRHPAEPDVACPTLIIHGTHDATVPIEGSRRYAAHRPNVRLTELDDDHRLLASADRIATTALEFLTEQNTEQL